LNETGKNFILQNFESDEETKKNAVDFNPKYLSKEANAIREKLKSRQLRTDPSKPFELKEDKEKNNLNNINNTCNNNDHNYQNSPSLKKAYEIEKKSCTKTYNTNYKNYYNYENLTTSPLRRFNINKSNSCDNYSNMDLDSLSNESRSTPNISEIFDSKNQLNLGEEEIRKLIPKNLVKQYKFKTDEEVKKHINKILNKKPIINQDKKIIENKNNENKKFNVNTNTQTDYNNILKEGNKTNRGFFNWKSNIKNKEYLKYNMNKTNNMIKHDLEFNNTRKNHIGNLIKFDKNVEKDNLKLNNKPNKLKNKINSINMENNEVFKNQTICSNDSCIKFDDKEYILCQNNPEKIGQDKSSSKLTELDKIIKNNINFYEIIDNKAFLLNEYKNSNFFNKFNFFEKNKKFKNELKKQMFKKNYFNSRNPSSDNSFAKTNFDDRKKSNTKDNLLSFKNLREKKFDLTYEKTFEYDRILKDNIDVMRSLFPSKNKNKAITSNFAFKGILNINDNLKYTGTNNTVNLHSNENTNLKNTKNDVNNQYNDKDILVENQNNKAKITSQNIDLNNEKIRKINPILIGKYIITDI